MILLDLFYQKGLQNHHFFHFDMEEGGLERIIKSQTKTHHIRLGGTFEALSKLSVFN